MANSRIKMILNPEDPKDTEILGQQGRQTASHRISKKMDLSIIEQQVGFKLMRPTINNLTLQNTMWIEGFVDYYGELSNGIIAQYRYGDNINNWVSIHQYKIINSNAPEIFSYPESITAFQKPINNGETTVVLIPKKWLESALPFAQWIVGDFLILMVFSWAVDEETIDSIINSVQVIL
jgi:hypothetical protein